MLPGIDSGHDIKPGKRNTDNIAAVNIPSWLLHTYVLNDHVLQKYVLQLPFFRLHSHRSR